MTERITELKQRLVEEATDLRLQARTETDPERILQLEAQASALESQWGSQGTLRLTTLRT